MNNPGRVDEEMEVDQQELARYSDKKLPYRQTAFGCFPGQKS